MTEMSPGSATSMEEDVLDDVADQVDALESEFDMVPLDHSRRMLLVHAHPDDETLATGGSMAHYAADNALVTLVTCTLGEEGEIVVDDLAHLASNREDALGSYRIGELATACEALGVTDHRFLGGPGRYRDSGMMGTPENEDPRCFWQANPDEAIADLVEIVRDVRPQVIITYDENGGYGHPDHIQAHRVAVAAFKKAADPDFGPELGEPWTPSKLYYAVLPESMLQVAIDTMIEAGVPDFFGGVTKAEDLPMATPDELVTTKIDAVLEVDAKMAALRAYRSQVSLDSPFFKMQEKIGPTAFGFEYFRLVEGEAVPAADGHENDLFAGVPV
jgi:N-acetyl-1-D-myo-inositol-2-amino-2-deoxy-alpha-D-glucopyranoside deacetylase